MKSKPHLTALLTYLPEQKGGRKTPVVNGSRVSLKFEMVQGDWLATVNFLEVEMAFAGDSVKANLTLPDFPEIVGSLHAGLDFEFSETGILNGQGTITKMLK